MGAESGLRRRVRGLSEAAFRGTVRDRGAVPGGAVPAALGPGLDVPGLRAWRLCRVERPVFQCNRCKHQVGLTAGTVFHWTKLPLTTWFLAIYHLTQSKGGMSSVELARRLGTRQPTAWLVNHKLMAAMGNTGREAQARGPNKDPRPKGRGIAEVSQSPACGEQDVGLAGASDERRKRRGMRPAGIQKNEIERLAKRNLAAGSNVVSDDLPC